MPGGFIGVDVFFVISGFLITNIIYSHLLKNEFSFIIFYKRRIRRIFPALFTVLFSSLTIGYFILFSDEYKQLGQHITYAAIFIQNFKLINELGYFDISSHYKPLLHLWTLSIEEQFYLIWPAMLAITVKFRLNALIVLSTIISGSFFLNVFLVTDYKDEVFFHSLTRFWELGIGSILAVLLSDEPMKDKIYRKTNPKLFFGIGIILIIFTAFWASRASLYPSWIGLLPTLGTALIIIANLQLPTWGGFVGIGLISYPIYLWHWVIISFCYIYLGNNPTSETLVIAIAVSFMLAYLTYKYVEKIRYTESNKIIASVIIASAFIGFGGLIVAKKDGIPKRSNLYYLEKFNAEFDRIPPTDNLCDSYINSIIKENDVFNYCRAHLNNPDRKIIAIIGDSHASVLYPGISIVAEKYDLDTLMIANSSCPPLVGFMWGKNDREIQECQINIQKMLKFIELDKRIETVVLSMRGPVYIHGEVQGKFSYASVNKSLESFKDPDRLTYETYFSGFKETLELLNRIPHVKNIYYLLENPELDFIPKEVIPRPYDIRGISIQDTTMDRSLYRLRMIKFRELVYDNSASFPKVNIIDVEPYMCEGNTCFAFKNGRFLYRDEDHFSVAGSNYIANKIENLLFNE